MQINQVALILRYFPFYRNHSEFRCSNEITLKVVIRKHIDKMKSDDGETFAYKDYDEMLC